MQDDEHALCCTKDTPCATLSTCPVLDRIPRTWPSNTPCASAPCARTHHCFTVRAAWPVRAKGRTRLCYTVRAPDPYCINEWTRLCYTICACSMWPFLSAEHTREAPHGPCCLPLVASSCSAYSRASVLNQESNVASLGIVHCHFCSKPSIRSLLECSRILALKSRLNCCFSLLRSPKWWPTPNSP